MPTSELFRELVEQHAIAALLKQQRLQRLAGEEAWSADLDAGRFAIGGRRFRADVLGTESAGARTWLWAWANPTFAPEQTLSASLLWQLGSRYGVDELVAAREQPLDVIEGHLAGMVGAGEANADAYYVGNHDDGAVVFLLRHPDLADAPFHAADLLGAANALAAGGLPLDVEAALEAFAAAPLEGFEVSIGRRTAELSGPGGSTATLELDRRGRVKGVRFESADAVPPPDDDAADAEPDEDEG